MSRMTDECAWVLARSTDTMSAAPSDDRSESVYMAKLAEQVSPLIQSCFLIFVWARDASVCPMSQIPTPPHPTILLHCHI